MYAVTIGADETTDGVAGGCDDGTSGRSSGWELNQSHTVLSEDARTLRGDGVCQRGRRGHTLGRAGR